MNHTSFDCPKRDVVYREPTLRELVTLYYTNVEVKSTLEISHNGRIPTGSPYFRTSVIEPAGIFGYCNIIIDRAVVERNFSVFYFVSGIGFRSGYCVVCVCNRYLGSSFIANLGD